MGVWWVRWVRWVQQLFCECVDSILKAVKCRHLSPGLSWLSWRKLWEVANVVWKGPSPPLLEHYSHGVSRNPISTISCQASLLRTDFPVFIIMYFLLQHRNAQWEIMDEPCTTDHMVWGANSKQKVFFVQNKWWFHYYFIF